MGLALMITLPFCRNTDASIAARSRTLAWVLCVLGLAASIAQDATVQNPKSWRKLTARADACEPHCTDVRRCRSVNSWACSVRCIALSGFGLLAVLRKHWILKSRHHLFLEGKGRPGDAHDHVQHHRSPLELPTSAPGLTVLNY
jgi:hypothetical protein